MKKKSKSLITRVISSITFYSSASTWVAAIVIMALVASDNVGLSAGVLALTLLVMVMVVYGMSREIRIVRIQVAEQRVELAARIDQLIETLKDAGVPVPAEPGEVAAAAEDVKQ